MPLASFAAVAFFTTIVGRLAFLAQQTFATDRCYSATLVSPGVMYGVYLSLLDFGDSASAWLSAPIISAFGIDYASDRWDGLVPLIALNIGMQVLILFLAAPLLLIGRSATDYVRVGDEELSLSSSG